MKNKIQIFIALLICGGAVIFNTAKAQSSSNNTIEEVQLIKNQTFNDIRTQLMDNFDFTNPDYKQGVVNSIVKFDISEKGKIVNVHATGDCKNVNREIETVLSDLPYKVNRKKLTENMMAYTFVMPVTVDINDR